MADSSEQKPQLCIGGCGFFGHPSFGNYCSVCFKQNKGSASAPATPVATHSPTPLASPSPSLAPAPATPSPIPTPEVASTPEPAVAEAGAETPPPARPVQKNVQKCWQCNKRVGLLGFKCKCDYVFCSNHRLSHAHNCIVDYQTLARGELETRLGDAIVPKKLERL